MKCFRDLSDIDLPASACAIGQFDGVHLGHQMVLTHALRQSRFLDVPSVVFTFANHPQSVVSKTPTPLLSTLEERLEQFELMGFDAALVLDFNTELQQTPAEQFVKAILVDALKVKSVSVGYDHRFGKDRQGDGKYLMEQGERFGFDVHVVEPVKQGNQIISSTLIRKLLSYGDLIQANSLLGRACQITGTVVSGVGRGRQIGVPTANLQLPDNRLCPANGVYAGYAFIVGHNDPMPAVCNIGVAPTFDDQTIPRMEVHLLNYEGDLYGKPLRFDFIKALRKEQTFDSVEALVEQIKQDITLARTVLKQHPTPSPSSSLT